MSTAAVARRPGPANETTRFTKVENPVARFRPGELYRLMAVRHGRKLPANDDGARFRDRLLDTLAMSGKDGRLRATNFLAFRCGWMSPADREDAIEAAFRRRRFWTPEALGNDLDVTETEHARARIRTFRIAGMTDADMKAKRAVKEAARKRLERLQQRLEATPRVAIFADTHSTANWSEVELALRTVFSLTPIASAMDRLDFSGFAAIASAARCAAGRLPTQCGSLPAWA